MEEIAKNCDKIVLGYSFYHFANNLLQIKYKKKQAINIISASHAWGVILSNLFFRYRKKQLNFLKLFSTTYFIFDTMQLLRSKKFNYTHYGYLFHHLSGIYLLTQDPKEIPLEQLFFLGELSNIGSYPLYHYLHKEGNHKEIIKTLRIFQKIIYTTIRIPVFTFLIHQYMNKPSFKKNAFAIVPLYLMGLIWSIKLLDQ